MSSVSVLSLRRIFLAFAFLLSSSIGLVAQFPMSMNRPPEDTTAPQVRGMVSQYCRLDYEGARLDSQLWPKLQPIVWWKNAPEFTQINVIARYTVDQDPVSDHGKFTVTVHYRMLGTYDLATGYLRESGATQDVSFIVSAENGEWRISDAENTYPHPSKTAMLKWLNEKLSATQDAATKARLQDALTQLQAQSGSPFGR
jgi:hypothetical protein